MPGTDTITVYRGEDAQLNFTMNPVEDITGWEITFTIEGVLYEKLVTQAATVDNGPAGQFSVALTPTQTDLRVGIYEYDVWRTDEGAERVIAIGNFVVVDTARTPP